MGNTLDVVTKFNELSLKLDQLLVKYQTLSTENIQTTSASIDFMQESDQKISAAMQCTVNGTSDGGTMKILDVHPFHDGLGRNINMLSQTRRGN